MCINCNCVLTGGAEYKIRIRSKTFKFEFHPTNYGGPAALTKSGEIAAAQPSYFLEAASLWHQQGRRLSDDGFCVWRYPPKDILKPLGGRHYLVTGQEDQPDQW